MMTMAKSTLEELVDPRRTAVLVVDVQPLFIGETLQPPVDQVLSALRRFLAVAREARVLRVFIRYMGAENPDERWKALLEQFGQEFQEASAPNSPEVVYAPGFEPEAGDLEVTKDRYSPFQRTGLADQLRRRDIETVIVAGLTTAVCVSSTARDAFQLDFHTITLSDCCAEYHSEHEAALQTLGRVFGRVCTSDEVIAAWQKIAAKAEREPMRP
jgi:ureidoacrylate peracid hydrolase